MPYVNPHDLDTLDAQKQGIFYPLVNSANVGEPAQDFIDVTKHEVSNFKSKWIAGSVAATAPASQTIWATPIYIPAGYPVGHITFCSGTTALSAGSNQVFGLGNSSLVQIVTTTDDTSTAWAASSYKTLAVAKVNNVSQTVYVVPTPTGGTINTPVLHYALFLVKATTVPTLACQVASLAAVTATPASGVTDQTSKTAILTDGSITFALATPNVNVPWVGISR